MKSRGMPIRGVGEKRTEKISGYIPPSLKQHYEAKVAAHPRKSISDVVFEALEAQAAIEIAHQKIGHRAGRN